MNKNVVVLQKESGVTGKQAPVVKTLNEAMHHTINYLCLEGNI